MGTGPNTSQAIGSVFFKCLGEADWQLQGDCVEDCRSTALCVCVCALVMS